MKVFESVKDSPRQSCAFPCICVLDSGRWIAACRAAYSKAGIGGQQHVLLSWSDDEGKTWSAPSSPFIPPEVCSRPGLFRSAHLTPDGPDGVIAVLGWVDNSNPGLPFFNRETEGLLDMRIFISRSEDGGLTWSNPRLIDTCSFGGPVPLTGPLLKLPGGELALQFELNKHYCDTRPWIHSAVLMFSRDGGETWPEYSISAKDPSGRIFYWDQRPGVLGGSRILNLFWTYARGEEAYLNIHARESEDGGRKWSEIRDTGVCGQPANPVPFGEKETAMVYVDRTGVPGVKMRVSFDSGRSFPAETETTIFQSGEPLKPRESSLKDAWAEMEKYALGLPRVAGLPGGDILVVFYAGKEADSTDIILARAAWSKGRKNQRAGRGTS